MNRLFIVDDSQQIRQRLVGLLAGTPNVRVVGQADTAEEAVHLIDTTRPDTLLIDIRLPGKSGIDLLIETKQRHPEINVIIMTNYDYAHYRTQSLKAGADAFFNKTTEFEALIDALRQTGSRSGGQADSTRHESAHASATKDPENKGGPS